MFNKIKIKKNILRIISSLSILSLLISFTIPSAVYAEKSDQVKEKSEAIYANLDGQGNVKNIYAVNHFSSESDEFIEDFGDYSEVESLSLTGGAKLDKDKVTVNKIDQNYYYKGKMNTNDLPWNINISHSLNNEMVEATTLSGADGKWELEISIEANDSKLDAKGENSWAKNLMLQISVTLGDKVAKNIVVDNGMLAEAGSNKLVTFMMMPNSDSTTYKIKADIEDFYLPSIQIAASPFSAEMFDFDTSSLSENDDLSTLQEATEKLSDGSSQLAAGLTELTNGSGQLEEGLDLLVENGASLALGGDELASGVNQYVTGINQLSANSQSLRDGVYNSAAGAGELSQGLREANSGLTQYLDGISQLTANLPALAAGSQELLQASQQIKEGFEALTADQELEDGTVIASPGQKLLYASDEIQSALDTIAESSPAIDQIDFAALGENLTNMKSQASQLKEELNPLVESLQVLKTSLDTIISGLNTIQSNLSRSSIIAAAGLTEDQLDEQAKEILAYVGNFAGDNPNNALALNIAGLQQMSDALNNVNLDGLTNILEGLNMLEELPDFSQLNQLTVLLSAIKDLNTNYSQFNNGLTQYISGVDLLSEGYSNNDPKLPDFYSGLNQFLSGLSQIPIDDEEVDTALDYNSVIIQAYTQLDQGLLGLSQGLNFLSEGVSGYTKGLDTLAGNSASINTGIGDYTDGTGQFIGGLNEWSEGFKTFNDNMIEVDKAGTALADGTKQLDQGISTMDEDLKEMIDELLPDFFDTEPVPSFVSSKNEDPTLVQFIMMTEAIEKKEVEIESETIVEEKNLWERFLDLFR